MFWRMITPIVILVGVALGQNNILNNGVFEYGLMCYNYYIWSSNGSSFGPSDYKVGLSTDAHSGSYSLELRCTGSDCLKAAAISNRIPVTPNTAYKLRLYSKCPSVSDSLASVYIPSTAGGDTGVRLICNDSWALNEINFTTNATDTDFFFYLFHIHGGIGLDWARYDDLVLTYADGSAPTPAVLYPGVRSTGVSGDKVLVDGLPYLALGFFDVNYHEIAQVAATGANTIFALGTHSSANCFNTGTISYLDRVYQSGMNFVPESTSTVRLGVPGVFPAVMQKFAPHLANVAWMLADEPDQKFASWWQIPGSTFVNEYNAAKTQTTLPLFADMQRAATGTTAEIAPYAPGLDFWMAEPYSSDFFYLNYAVGLMRSVRQLPIWLAQDAIDAPHIVPKAYWAVVNGATGIAYFNWDQFKADPAKLAASQQVFGEMKQLKNVIFGQNINSLVTVTPGIGYSARYAGGAAYILSAYSLPQSVPALFQVKGVTAGQQIQVLFENRSITAANGSFTDTFAGISRHVYVINSPLPALSGTLQYKTGSDNARVWSYHVFNSGTGPATGAAITNLTFTLTGGKFCSPTILPGQLPVSLGAIQPGGSAVGAATISFIDCDATSRFTVSATLSSNSGAVMATVLRNNERK